ncbi:hypothetical protein HDU91_006306 [Kappamyces sp. JEL0680]|nr:hypothetical protein HDU91_006306 [Kappamyces sp. JEL0680]
MQWILAAFGLLQVSATLLYLTRHGEKPEEWKSVELSKEGVERSRCLRDLFLKQRQGLQTPQRIIAQPAGPEKKSKRPVATVAPLAHVLGLTIEQHCGYKDYDCIENSIRDSPLSPVLVSWQHKRLSKIAARFLPDEDVPHYPKDRYDLIWVIDTDKNTLDVVEEDCGFRSQGSNPLPTDSLCGPAYAGFYVNKSLKEFNDGMASTINNTANADALEPEFCVAPAIYSAVNSLRYQASFMCSFYTNQAIVAGCPLPPNAQTTQPNGPLLCPIQCNLAFQTLNNILTNKATCPNGGNFPINVYRDFCSSLQRTIPQNKNTCNNGTTTDVTFCGFPDQATALSQCPGIASDSCCAALLSASQSTESPSSGSNSKIVIIVVATIVSVVLVVGVRASSRVDDYEASSVHKEMPPLAAPQFDYKTDSKQEFSFQNSQAFETKAVAPQDKPKSFLKAPNLSLASPLPPVPESIPQDETLIPLADMPEGTKTMKVLHPYDATLDDELTLVPGTNIYMVRSFDDGWALGVDPRTGDQGAFPLVCAEELQDAPVQAPAAEEIDPERINRRHSSMILKDLPKGNSRSKVPFSLYLQELDNGFGSPQSSE